MGEQSSSLVTPMPAIIRANAGKSWSLERRGHTWLPMGRPSGLATSSVALPASDPAMQPIAALAMNSRLDITFTSVSFLCLSQSGRYFRLRRRFARGSCLILAPAESQSSLRPPSLSQIEVKFTSSPVGPASRKIFAHTLHANIATSTLSLPLPLPRQPSGLRPGRREPKPVLDARTHCVKAFRHERNPVARAVPDRQYPFDPVAP